MMFSRYVGCERHAAAVALAILAVLAVASSTWAQTPWPVAGGDISDSHMSLSPVGPNQLDPSNARNLHVKWQFQATGDIAATPTVEPGGLYVPDWGPANESNPTGTLWKLDPDTGAVIWRHPVSDYTGMSGSRSRTSPAIGALGEIIIGDQNWGSSIMSINKMTGQLNWITHLDSYGPATITAAPVIYNGIVYAETSSWQEVPTGSPPAFRGTIAALNEATGAVLWTFRTVPPGYTGGAITGSSPVVFPPAHALLIAADNNYTIPATASACLVNLGSGDSVPAQLGCLDPADYVDSILSLDLTTGKLNWSRGMQGADTWNIDCSIGPASGCPVPPGTDRDFASAPNLIWLPNFVGVPDDRSATSGILSKDYILGVGEKSGIYWGLNPFDGGLFWQTSVGNGGIQWGSAVAGEGLYSAFVALNNAGNKTNTLVGRNGVRQIWNGGAWASLDLYTGAIQWQIPASGNDLVDPSEPAHAPGSLSYSNYLLFAGASSGDMVAISADTGYTYWTFNSGGSVVLHPAVFNDTLYWGSGYGRNGVSNGGILYAFTIQ
jgi:polyvinyl alcohol dehydrogenase (cytochrome)